MIRPEMHSVLGTIGDVREGALLDLEVCEHRDRFDAKLTLQRDSALASGKSPLQQGAEVANSSESENGGSRWGGYEDHSISGSKNE